MVKQTKTKKEDAAKYKPWKIWNFAKNTIEDNSITDVDQSHTCPDVWLQLSVWLDGFITFINLTVLPWHALRPSVWRLGACSVSLLSQEKALGSGISRCCISCSICRPPGDCLNTSTAPWMSALLTFQCQAKERQNCLLNAMLRWNLTESRAGVCPQRVLYI